VRAARKAKEMTLATLARLTRVDRSQLDRIERAPNSRPSPQTLVQLSRALGVSVDWLVGRTQDRGSPGPDPLEAVRELIADLRAVLDRHEAMHWPRRGRPRA
jgi:transcriptional regulator with XRE-family HTH domain